MSYFTRKFRVFRLEKHAKMHRKPGADSPSSFDVSTLSDSTLRELIDLRYSKPVPADPGGIDVSNLSNTALKELINARSSAQ